VSRIEFQIMLATAQADELDQRTVIIEL